MTDNTKTLKVEYRDIGSLIPYVNNSRTHSDEQITQVASSIKEFGFTNPILIDEDGGIIAGHGRVMAAKLLNMETVPTIVLAGLSKAQKKAYVIADNKLALNSGWDNELLTIELESLKLLDFDFNIIGFDEDELIDLAIDVGDINPDSYSDSDGENEDSPYSQKIASPIYEPSEETPLIEEMFDAKKSLELINRIENSIVDDELKVFLRMAAYRHTVFNYSKIADYYSNADKDTQALMEESALVIIDFNKAIEGGFVTLSDELKEIMMKDYE